MSHIQQQEKPANNYGFCSACGVSNWHTAQFCHQCGAKLPWANSAVAPPETQAQQTTSPLKIPQLPPLLVQNSSAKPKSSAWKWALGLWGFILTAGLVGYIDTEKKDAQKRDNTLAAQRIQLDAQRARATYLRKHPEIAAKERLRLAQERKQRLKAVQEQSQRRRAQMADIAQAQGKRKKAVTAFADLLNNEGNGQLFSNLGTQDKKLVVVGTDAWNAQPYRYRLQRAQALYMIWLKACGTDDPHQGSFEIQDTIGNKIGGWNGLSGIWVTEN